MTKQHSHNFVENYTGLLAQGLDKETDINTLKVYLQKLADDNLLEVLLPRLNNEEINTCFENIFKILQKHFSEKEYHNLFLKLPPEKGSRQI